MSEKKENESNFDLSTLLVHADDDCEPLVPDLAPPIHMTTTFKYMNGHNPEGYTYSRFDQPTRKRVEQVLGALEGGKAVIYSSGSAATFAALLYFRPKRIFINQGYSGTHAVIQNYFSPIDMEWYKNILTLKEGIKPETGDLLWLETPKNPTCDIEDIAYYSELAHKSGAIVVVDSTFGTPVLQKPLELGADVVLHSCTKFLSGQSDVLAGVLVTKDSALASGFKLQRTITGSILGNLENYLLLRSLRTLELRVKRSSKTATAIASFLDEHPNVIKVWHPSLPSHSGYALCAKQMKRPPPILSFAVESEEEARLLLTKLKLISVATSLGGIHTTIDWRYKFDSKVEPNLLRLSIGIESKKDLMVDLKQGLDQLKIKT